MGRVGLSVLEGVLKRMYYEGVFEVGWVTL